jgi:3-hydroxyacyl-CoA dehydrogenase
MLKLDHVAIIGGGIMGGGIAAFFANNGVKKVSVFDLNQELADASLDKLTDKKAKIPTLYTHKLIKGIHGYPTSDLSNVAKDADMIVEVVPEVMDLKKKIFQDVDSWRRDDSIVCTNTSGLSVNKMVEGCSDSMKKHFMGIHYFNPVRFLPLVELIPGETTDSALMDEVFKYYQMVGKKPVIGKDTPNFIANRVGVYTILKTMHLTEKYRFSVEDVDMITGPALASPKTASYRLCDMVGNDTLQHAAMNSYENCPEDEARNDMKPPAFFDKMIEMNLLGDKTQKGFFQKVKDEKGKRQILALDLETMEYRPSRTPRSLIVKNARGYANPCERVREMVWYGDDPVSNFSKELILSYAAYALNRVGEIADDHYTIDNALKWGFAKECGAAECLDYLGLEKSAQEMSNLGIKVPKMLTEAINTTGKLYNKTPKAETQVFDMAAKEMKSVPEAPNVINLEKLRAEGRVVRENLSARLIDLGDQVLGLELANKMVPHMNPIDDYVLSMLWQAQEVIPEGGYKGLVVTNQAQNFCAGAQLMMILELSKRKMFDMIEQVAMLLQMGTKAMLHAPYPVVTAPHGMTLGGGMEVTLGAQKRVVAAEFYGGLVEVGVGLVPAGGGCMLLSRQFQKEMAPARPGPVPPVFKAFDLIGFGKVSNSAHNAIEMGLLTKNDIVVLNKDQQVAEAKKAVLEMAENFEPIPEEDLIFPGESARMVMEQQLETMISTGKITDHSVVIARHQANILTGGEKASPVDPVSEDYILQLEREAFLSLCGEPMSQARMAHMLKKGKPLIN